MMSDTTVYALYSQNSGLVHNHSDCAGDILYSDESHIFAIRADGGELTEVQPIYSIDDTEPRGMTCDSCGEYIFDPDYRGILNSAVEEILNNQPQDQARETLVELFTFQGSIDELVFGAIVSAVDSAETIWRRASSVVDELAPDEQEYFATLTEVWEEL